MYQRILNITQVLRRKSLFLLGPRQTGKSTYLRSHFPEALYINLLKSSEYQNYLKDPSYLHKTVNYFVKNNVSRIVIVDEIQKIPNLLNDIHDLIEQDKSLRFILTGSSARKLRRGGANLLGGRASRIYFHPLCYPELGINQDDLWIKGLSSGKLPPIIDTANYFEDLKDYVGLYLREEIQEEGLTRSLENFSRFLDVAALMNGEQINYTALGSDAQIAPTLVKDYFEILSDTLVGHLLPAFLATTKRKAMSTSKFYFFDNGVVNALTGRSIIPKGTPEFGKSFELAIYSEILAYLNYRQSSKKVEYWRSTSKFEVDFLVYDRIEEIVAIEVKSSTQPSKKDFKGLLALEEEHKLLKKIIVCQAEKPLLTEEEIEILPVFIFLKRLWQGELF
ncbi:MAG: ATP-binding protein [Bdellovibrionales bacterium]|nr:ATP-binding protein [Bdellovibrionales bacterium]